MLARCRLELVRHAVTRFCERLDGLRVEGRVAALLARTLFGDASPSGRLTASFPRAVGQEPLYYNRLNTGRPARTDAIAQRFTSGYADELTTPQFPFGWGLTYTHFTYSAPTLLTKAIRAADLTKPMTGDDFARALHIVSAFAGFGPKGGGELQCLDPRLFAVLIGLACVHWCNFKGVFSTWWRNAPEPVFATAYGCLATLVLLFIPTKYAPFIYFQF